MSKRAQMRSQQKQRERNKRLTGIAVVAALAMIVAVLVIRLGSKPVGEIVAVSRAIPAYADGKALGTIDAPVIVQDFSNFT